MGNNTKSIVSNEIQTMLQQIQKNPEISMANGIFVQQEYQIRPNFSVLAHDKFYANVTNMNFKQSTTAANILNNWVSEETHGQINDLFNAQSIQGSKMVLVNAIYFNGNWSVPFYKRSTYKDKFQLGNCNSSTNIKRIDFMHNSVIFLMNFNSKL